MEAPPGPGVASGMELCWFWVGGGIVGEVAAAHLWRTCIVTERKGLEPGGGEPHHQGNSQGADPIYSQPDRQAERRDLVHSDSRARDF